MYLLVTCCGLLSMYIVHTYVYHVGGSSEAPQLKLKYYVGDLPLLCVNCFVMISTHFLIVFGQLDWTSDSI